MTKNEEIIKELKLEESGITRYILEFFEKSNYFDHPLKKGSFLVGMLARRVAYEQYKSLGSEPFYEKLFGLRLDLRKVRRLLTETMAKLREYNSPTNKAVTKNVLDIETLASYFLTQDNHGQRLSNDDISFSFASGLALSYPFFSKTGEIKEEMEDE